MKKNQTGYIKAYLSDRKKVLFLFFLTFLCLLGICALYQVDNWEPIVYGASLATFFWLLFGVWDIWCYRKTRQKLLLSAENPELAEEILQELCPTEIMVTTAGSCVGKHMARAYADVIIGLGESLRDNRSREEFRRTESSDYYLMWAHQIKTPLSAMKLLISEREDGFLLSKELFETEQYVEMALHYQRLDSIALDMLLQEYDLYTMVKETVKKFSILFIGSGISLKLEEFQAVILTDEKWFCFVLEQLLSNSIKYTKKGSISIYMESGKDKTLVIEDTGIGIRQEDLPRIFERGFTGYNGRMDKKSTGIGLYLCRRVLKQLSHEIHVESREGEGTKVFLDFPVWEGDKNVR